VRGSGFISSLVELTPEKLINSDEHSVNRELSIRYNQLINMFDRFPLASAICYTEDFRLRVVNPAFGEAVGGRENLVGEMQASDGVNSITSPQHHIGHNRHCDVSRRSCSRGLAHLADELVGHSVTTRSRTGQS
jgi:hypothetical protein